MTIDIAGQLEQPQTIVLSGKRFVVLPEVEYRRLQRSALGGAPPRPPRDARGNYPAAEALAVSIARSIVRSRRAAGLTQAELARRANIRPETLNRIEQGRHAPSVPTLESLERALSGKNTSRAQRRTKKTAGTPAKSRKNR
jgi:ribosome-binding protein aMBF1 (putative translation factor)